MGKNRAETEIYLETDESESKTETTKCSGFEDFLNKMSDIADRVKEIREQDMRKWTKNLYQDMEDYDRMTVHAKTLEDIAKIKELILSRAEPIHLTTGPEKKELLRKMDTLLARLETKKERFSIQTKSPAEKEKAKSVFTLDDMLAKCSDSAKKHIKTLIIEGIKNKRPKDIALTLDALIHLKILDATKDITEVTAAIFNAYGYKENSEKDQEALRKGIANYIGENCSRALEEKEKAYRREEIEDFITT